MSNERRHELEKNDLAILLDRISNAIEPYSKLIVIGIGALFVGFISWLVYNSQVSGDRSDSTLELIQAVAGGDAEVLKDVTEKFPGTTAAAWAGVYQGQLQLSQGIQTLYRDKEEAKQLLEDAKGAFESAMVGSQDPLLRSRAQIGIARAEESLGNFESAVSAYEKVVSIGESEAIVKQAEQRIAALGDPKTKEFLTWFDDQRFAPADPSLPPSLPGLENLSDFPEFSLTDLPGGESATDKMDLDTGIELPDADTEQPSGESEAEAIPEDPVADSTESKSPEAEGGE